MYQKLKEKKKERKKERQKRRKKQGGKEKESKADRKKIEKNKAKCKERERAIVWFVRVSFLSVKFCVSKVKAFLENSPQFISGF